MASERAEFIATMNLEQVDSSIKRTRANIDQSIGGAATSALDKFDGATNKAAKAVGALGFAMGGMGNATRGALKDVGDIAMILGSGGVLGIALTGAAFAFGKLYSEAVEADRKMDDLKRTLREGVAKALDDVAKRAEEAQAKLTNLGLTPQTIARNQAETALGSAIAQEQNAQIALRAWMDRRNKLLAERTSMDQDEFIARSQQLKADNAVLKSLLDKARASIPHLQATLEVERKLLEIETEEAKKRFAKTIGEPSGGRGGSGGKSSPKKEQAASEMEFAFAMFDLEREEQKRQDEIRLRDTEKAAADELEVWRAQKQARIQIAAEQQAALEARNKEYADSVVGYASIAQAGTQQLVEDLITGQKYALESFGAFVMQQAGASIVGSGLKLLGEAVFSVLTPGMQANAPGQFAGAAALIGVGTAMGGGGGAWAASIGIREKADADAEKKKAKAKADRGAPLQRRTGGGRGSGGGSGLTIVNQWGVAGPTADDQARAMSRVLDRVRDGRF